MIPATAHVTATVKLDILSIKRGLSGRHLVKVRDPDGHTHTLHAGDILNLNVALDFAAGSSPHANR